MLARSRPARSPRASPPCGRRLTCKKCAQVQDVRFSGCNRLLRLASALQVGPPAAVAAAAGPGRRGTLCSAERGGRVAHRGGRRRRCDACQKGRTLQDWTMSVCEIGPGMTQLSNALKGRAGVREERWNAGVRDGRDPYPRRVPPENLPGSALPDGPNYAAGGVGAGDGQLGLVVAALAVGGALWVMWRRVRRRREQRALERGGEAAPEGEAPEGAAKGRAGSGRASAGESEPCGGERGRQAGTGAGRRRWEGGGGGGGGGGRGGQGRGGDGGSGGRRLQRGRGRRRLGRGRGRCGAHGSLLRGGAALGGKHAGRV